MMSRRVLLFIAALSAAATGIAAPDIAVPPTVIAALADSHRPAEQSKLDAQRKPAQMIAFAGVKTGDQVADFMPGNGYFSRILSKIVGPAGKVYAFTPEEQIKNCEPSEMAGSRAIEHNPAYRNVAQLAGPVNYFSTPRKLDVIWIAQNYHDLHDSFLGPADIKLVNKAFFDSLKSGGVLMIIDHAAASGSGLRDTDTLHRIDPSSVRGEVEAAGFVFVAQIDDLSNLSDDHVRSVFDPVIRGKTDQFVYKFRKPDKSF
jgi:predicted methyltransferase